MDLKSFSGAGEEKNEQPAHEDVYKAINYYSKFSNEQLMTELAKQLAAQRKKGKGDEILRTVERIRPFLNPEQQKRLEEILKNVGG